MSSKPRAEQLARASDSPIAPETAAPNAVVENSSPNSYRAVLLRVAKRHDFEVENFNPPTVTAEILQSDAAALTELAGLVGSINPEDIALIDRRITLLQDDLKKRMPQLDVGQIANALAWERTQKRVSELLSALAAGPRRSEHNA